MAYAVAAEEVEPVVRGLLGLIDVDGGPTAEQLDVLWSITGHLWRRPDLAGASLSPLSPRELAAALDDERARRRFHVIAVTLELCRHPLSEAQVRSAEAYAAALDIDGADLLIMRDWIDVGVGRAMEDWKRCFGAFVETNSEVALRSEEPLTEAEVWEPQGPTQPCSKGSSSSVTFQKAPWVVSISTSMNETASRCQVSTKADPYKQWRLATT